MRVKSYFFVGLRRISKTDLKLYYSIGSYDMSVYQDDDGRAYLIRSVVNQFVGISLLSEDYLTSQMLVSYIGGTNTNTISKTIILCN